jgi:hypothetical protein
MDAQMWPTNGHYVESAANPEYCFEDPELARGMIDPGPTMGIPECATGQNAIVFPVHTTTGKWAVRCFTTPAGDCERRYAALVQASWLERGIRVGADWWPIVKMRWAEGVPLNEAVETRLEDPAALRVLATRWREAVRELRFAKLAHGDLQHGNVVVDEQGAMRFVDYDGMWIPTIADLNVREVGHPNYQHPQRTELQYWTENVDTFAALVIYTSLHALAAEPSLWPELNNGENLIFSADDFLAPRETPIWSRLEGSRNAEVRMLAGLLDRACATTVAIPTDLDEILETRRIVGPVYPAQWWDPAHESVVKPEPAVLDDTAHSWGDWDEERDDEAADEASGDDDSDDSTTSWARIVVVAVVILLMLGVLVGVLAAHQ